MIILQALELFVFSFVEYYGAILYMIRMFFDYINLDDEEHNILARKVFLFLVFIKEKITIGFAFSVPLKSFCGHFL